MMPATMTPAPLPVTTKPSPREPGPSAPPTQGPVLVETTIVEALPRAGGSVGLVRRLTVVAAARELDLRRFVQPFGYQLRFELLG